MSVLIKISGLKKHLAHYRRTLLAIFTIAGFVFSAPLQAQGVKTETVASGLQNPWSLAFLPDGRFLVTERAGSLRVVGLDGKLGNPLAGMPPMAVGGQGGLLDVVLDADFARNRVVYFCFSEPAATGTANSTALARATLNAEATALENVRTLFSQKPKVVSGAHFGCRIVESRSPGVDGKPDGKLFLTLGDRFSRKEDAQKLDNHLGKIVRINKDGTVPTDNPFVGQAGALPEIWSYGHRNSQGATLAPDGTFWMHEHGPQGGDEINLPKPGANYGWPVITYGENYGGGKIGAGLTEKAGMEQPLHQWTPSIGHGFSDQRALRQGLAWQSVCRLAEVWLPGPNRTVCAFWREGGAGKQAADRWRRAHSRCEAGPGRLALRADGQRQRQAAAPAAGEGPIARKRASRVRLPTPPAARV